MQRLSLKSIYFLILFVFVCITGTNEVFGQGKSRIYLSQSRSGAIINASTVSEAGGDISSTVETDPAFISLNISTFWRYRILIRQENVNWDGNLRFYVRRTGNGYGNGKISGGTNYILLDAFNQSFFSGRRSRSSIPIQYKIEGISLTVPAGDHETNVVYTITDN